MKGRRLVMVVLAACSCSGKSPSPAAEDKPAPEPPASKQQEAEPLEADTANPETHEWDNMRLETLEVEGPRSGDEILTTARQHASELIGCYEKFAEEDPTLKGKLALRLLVTPQGEVTDALIHNNKLEDHRVGTCMLPLVKEWKLPATDDPEPTRVVLPMVFGP